LPPTAAHRQRALRTTTPLAATVAARKVLHG